MSLPVRSLFAAVAWLALEDVRPVTVELQGQRPSPQFGSELEGLGVSPPPGSIGTGAAAQIWFTSGDWLQHVEQARMS